MKNSRAVIFDINVNNKKVCELAKVYEPTNSFNFHSILLLN
jgi:hypothetical protein